MTTAARMPLGPVMLDVAGTTLAAEERARLLHPLTGGVILFGRNYAAPDQVASLVAEIRSLRDPRVLVAVDHEGGRVQRFRSGFTGIPPMAALGRHFDQDPRRGLRAAHAAGVLIAAELAACGIDFSFTPVLDLDYGASGVIGDRAFHRDPLAVGALAGALMGGLRERGMAAVGKHFPGHGHVAEDSHLAFPVDPRPLEEIEARDLLPYRELIPQGLQGIMPAHVIYPAVDAAPAGFSSRWLQEVLRGRLGFRGTIFSDDLSMEAATVAGGIVERATAALQAGCDMVLVCNQPQSADALLDGLRWSAPAGWEARLDSLYGRAPACGMRALPADGGWQQARADIIQLA